MSDADKPAKQVDHEMIRSIGVVLSLVLSVASLSFQLWPKGEKADIEPGVLLDAPAPQEPRTTNGLPKGNRSMIGPLFWKVIVNNTGPTPLSLKEVQPRLRDRKWGTYYVSGSFERATLEDGKTSALPFVVPAYESRAMIIEGFLPGWFTWTAQSNCLQKDTTALQYSACAAKTGVDVFGNKLELIHADDGRVIAEEWPTDFNQPALELTFKSNKGQVYRTSMTLVPMLGRAQALRQ